VLFAALAAACCCCSFSSSSIACCSFASCAADVDGSPSCHASLPRRWWSFRELCGFDSTRSRERGTPSCNRRLGAGVKPAQRTHTHVSGRDAVAYTTHTPVTRERYKQQRRGQRTDRRRLRAAVTC
jgi:hypothetical protein